MDLFHFTSATLAEAVFASSLSKGHVPTENQEMLHDVVWLTTERLPFSHGLLTGKEQLSDSQAAYSARVQGVKELGNRVTVDKTQVRICVPASKLNPKLLVKYSSWARETGQSKTYVRFLGLSAAVPNLATRSAEEMHRLFRRTETKEETWYLHFGPIDPALFKSVDFRQKDVFVPYDFETHGRALMEKSGLAVVGENSLKSLASIVLPSRAYDHALAYAFAAKPDDSPMAIIRCAAYAISFEIEQPMTFRVIDGELPLQITELVGWIDSYRNELMQCHERSLASYRRHFLRS